MHKAVLHQHAVLAPEGDDVADGADSGEVGIVLEQAVDVRVLAFDGLYQLEGNADSRQLLELAGTVGTVQVDDRCGVGQDIRNGVVIGDDGIYAEGFGVCDLIDGGNAVVDGHDELHPAGVELGHGVAVHPVALGLTRGDVADYVGSDVG